MTDTPTLGEHEGRPIDEAAMTIIGIGGGLDDPLAIDPEHIPIGGARMACIPIVCIEHKHAVIDRKEPGESGLRLVHIFKADGPVFYVDPTIVDQARGEHLTKVMLAQKAIDDAKEAAAKAKKGNGQTAVAPDQSTLGVDDQALVQQHLAGDHVKEINDDCPECQWENTLVDEEKVQEIEPGDES